MEVTKNNSHNWRSNFVTLLTADRAESTVRVYEMMKSGGWRCNSEADGGTAFGGGGGGKKSSVHGRRQLLRCLTLNGVAIDVGRHQLLRCLMLNAGGGIPESIILGMRCCFGSS
ncbi:hypothetical protein L1987_12074 [Smallanthus sonchifolius]|uniref:Uncharacterized protein n=1 Tax=Smallanthus sonchifolius TaxID=185202 RepID=A0ACB9JFE5_9ASTR|nr:hypothetical protein L1987_12074 [Smallanthus sonchifolius]